MRIGILTFHYAHNYGAVLQSYALQYKLKSMGHEVFFINHQNTRIANGYKVFDINRYIHKNPIKCLQNSIKELKTLHRRKKRSDGFKHFIAQYLHIVEKEEILSNPFDCIIVGSDQVWNTNLTKGFDNYYWGIFQKPTHTRLISYAASMEEYWTDKNATIIKNLLNKFDAISVREKKLEDELSRLLHKKEIITVADPTMIVEEEVWNTLSSPPPINKPYLLLYQVRNSSICESIAQQIAKEMNLKIIYLSASVLLHNSDECIATPPEEYLGWFKYASFVVCSSFHGTVFSLLFERPFYSIQLNDGRDSRVYNLLNVLNLSDRFITSYRKGMNNEDINFQKVKESINSITVTSNEFLTRNLQA